MQTAEAISTPTVLREPLTVCPLCDTPLDPNHPTECSRCDWVLGYRRHQATPIGTERDAYSVILSVVPGLGHIYKGHLMPGLLFMAGWLLAIFVVSVIATFTMGFGLLLLPLYWVGVMMHVYWLEDLNAPQA